MVEMSEGRNKILEYDIGKRLRDIRGEWKLSLSEASAKMGVSESYLSLLENNKRRVNIEILEKLGSCYDMKLHEFFQRPKRRTPQVPGSSLERSLKGQKATDNPFHAKGFRRQHRGFGHPQEAGPKVIIF